MTKTERHLESIIRNEVQEIFDELLSEGTEHIVAIRQGMKAGEEASRRAQAYRSPYGISLSDQIKQDRAERAAREKEFARHRDRISKLDSAGEYLQKVFGDKAKVYSNATAVSLGNKLTAEVGIEETGGLARAKFVVTLRLNDKTLKTQDFGIGIGAKQNIARYLKKLEKHLEGQSS
jgi:hypothetical protein